jgi:hypothetical protein
LIEKWESEMGDRGSEVTGHNPQEIEVEVGSAEAADSGRRSGMELMRIL